MVTNPYDNYVKLRRELGYKVLRILQPAHLITKNAFTASR